MGHFRPSELTAPIRLKDVFSNRLHEVDMEELTLQKIRRFAKGRDLWTGKPLCGLDADNNLNLKSGRPEKEPEI